MVRFVAEARDFSLLHSIQPSSAAHPASYAVDIPSSLSSVKQLGCEADHSPSSSAKVRSAARPPIHLLAVLNDTDGFTFNIQSDTAIKYDYC